MDIVIAPKLLRGTIQLPPSKSILHRLLICAAFADQPTVLHFSGISKDIAATIMCLKALGTEIACDAGCVTVFPASELPKKAVLNCGESGSTLRFLLPVVGALGVDGTFLMEGRLPCRPLSPLWEEMERMGCVLTRPTENTIRCCGQLQAGLYSIDGSVSSQFITGLMLGLNLLPEKSQLTITGKAGSKPYIQLTRNVLRLYGIDPELPGGQAFCSAGNVTVEGDWSSGAFFHVANAIGSDLCIKGLSADSAQGDRAVTDILTQLDSGMPTVSAAHIPDLIPILSVAAACKQGAVFTDIARLRLKESDRVASICAMLEALGGKATATENTLTVYPCRFSGGTVDACGDHRIAMSAAIAATVAMDPVTVLGAECVQKSYPTFWAEYTRLGGSYEQYIR